MPGLDETENELRWRIKNPDMFDEFRTKEITDGVSIILGKLKGEDKWVVQALRFNKDKFDKTSAKKWIDEHSGDFFKNECEDEEKKYAIQDTFDIEGVEIFAIGEWNGDKYSKTDLETMVKSFEETKDLLKPYLKLGHDDKQDLIQSDGFPAIGWIDKLRVMGKKLVADIRKVPKKIYDLIKNGAYRRISSEIFFDMKLGNKTYPRLLKAVALLGADTPAVTTIDDIINLYVSGNDTQLYSDADTKVKTYDIEKTVNNKKGEDDMDLEQLKKEKEEVEAKLKVMEEEKIAIEKKFNESLIEIEKIKTDLKTFQDEAKKHKEEKIKSEIATFVDGLINNKELGFPPVLKEKLNTLLYEVEILSNVNKYSFDNKEMTIKDLIMEMVSTNKVALNTEGKTQTGGLPQEDKSDLRDKAIKYAKDNNVSYKEALIKVS